MTLQKLSHNFTKIELRLLYTKNISILLVTFLALFMNNACFGQELPAKNGISIPADIDSTSQNGLEIPKSNDFEKPQIKETDTIRVKDSLKIKETLTGVVKYQAKDYNN